MHFLNEEFGIDASDIGDETPLISSGIVDSLGLLSFVEFVATSAGITVSGDEIRIKHFDTVSLILNFVAYKQAT